MVSIGLLGALCVGNVAASTTNTVVGWGNNWWGQTNVPDGLGNVAAIAAGWDHSLALESDGTVVAWGANYYGEGAVPASVSNVVAIAAGAGHNLALQADGTVAAWGQITAPEGLSNVVAVGAGYYHGLAVKSDGTVAVWGDNEFGQTVVPAGLSNVVAVSGGCQHSLALKSDGTVVGWGGNEFGQASVPAGLSNVMAVACGGYHSLALRKNGTVLAWGYSTFGQTTVPSGLSNVVAVAAGDLHSIALKADGTVVVWGAYADGPGQSPMYVPPGLSNIVAIAAGWGDCLALEGSLAFPPTIQIQPLSCTNSAGTPVTFAVTALGTPPLAYQWSMNNTNISDATNAALTTPNVQGGDAGTYAVNVSNRFGSIVSSNATLTIVEVPPVIIAQPLSRTNAITTTATFTVVAHGTAPLNYQWRKDAVELSDGSNVFGAGTATLIVSQVLQADAGDYTVAISNTLGSVLSSNAFLFVADPAIISSPSSRTNNPGTTATFNVTALGSSPLSYQWQKNGTNLADGSNVSGSTTDVLTLSDVAEVDAGSYGVVVTNEAGIANSSTAILSIIPPPTITMQPASRTNNTGATAIFTVAATGIPPLTYRWQYDSADLFNGGRVSGATSSRLVIANVGRANGGDYRVAVSDAAGSVTSVVAQLTVQLARQHVAAWGNNDYHQSTVPGTMIDPVAVAGGEYHSLGLTINGTIVPWGANFWNMTNVPSGVTNVIAIGAGIAHSLALKENGTVVAWGAGTTNLGQHPHYGQSRVPEGLTNAVAIAAGDYHCLAVRNDGTVLAWGFNSQGQCYVPWGLSNVIAVAAGLYSSLALRADGTVAVWGTDLWGLKDVPPGLTNVVAIAAGGLHSLALRDDGTVVAWGDDSNGETNVPPDLTNVVAIAAGGYHSLALKADGTVVAWGAGTNNGSWPISGQSIVPAYLGNAVGISGGDVHSLALVNDGPFLPPAIVSHPASGTNDAGTTVAFYATASGTAPLHYQWRKDSVDLSDSAHVSGATSATLRVSSVLKADEGNYHVVVTNTAGSATSSNASLTVIDPWIALQPASRTNEAAASANFRVLAIGTAPFAYQWQKDGTNLPDATNATLFLSRVGRRDSGVYAVNLTNAYGNLASSNAILVVISPQRLSLPVFLPDGSCAITSGDSDGGLLLPDDLPHFEAQTSTNLATWAPLTNGLILTNGQLLLYDPGRTNLRYRFYRVIER